MLTAAAAAAFLSLAALFHHCPGRDFFGAFAVTAGPLSGLFDVFVLALLFAAGAPEMLLTWHVISSSAATLAPKFD